MCTEVARFVHGSLNIMTTMDISLPDSLRDYVADRVVEEGFSTPSEYVRTLIREDKRRRDLFRQCRAGLEALQRTVLQGIGDADAGRMHDLDDVVSDVKRRD